MATNKAESNAPESKDTLEKPAQSENLADGLRAQASVLLSSKGDIPSSSKFSDLAGKVLGYLDITSKALRNPGFENVDFRSQKDEAIFLEDSYKASQSGNQIDIDQYKKDLHDLSNVPNYDYRLNVSLQIQEDNTAPKTVQDVQSLVGFGTNFKDAAHDSNQPDELAKLAKVQSLDVRLEVANNQATSPDTLDQLANDLSDRVRASVAGNLHTPVATLTKLSDDPVEQVSRAAAINPKAKLESVLQVAGRADNRILNN